MAGGTPIRPNRPPRRSAMVNAVIAIVATYASLALWWGGGSVALATMRHTTPDRSPTPHPVTSTTSASPRPTSSPARPPTPPPAASAAPPPSVSPAPPPSASAAPPPSSSAASPASPSAAPSTASPSAAPTPSTPYYADCADAWQAGVAPLLRGEPGYRPELDGDRDGVACEQPPRTTPPAQPSPPDQPAPPGGPAPYYDNCTDAWNAGAAPLHRGEPGYRPGLDRDGDGIACEQRPH